MKHKGFKCIKVVVVTRDDVIGTRVYKVQGGLEYRGKIKRYDPRRMLYTILFEDGSQEEWSEEDVAIGTKPDPGPELTKYAFQSDAVLHNGFTRPNNIKEYTKNCKNDKFKSMEEFCTYNLDGNAMYVKIDFDSQNARYVLKDAGIMDGGDNFLPTGLQMSKNRAVSLIVFLSFTETSSQTHRDDTHSVLYCPSGKKLVYLAPPYVHHQLKEYQIDGEPNSLKWDPFQYQEQHDRIYPEWKLWKLVELNEGEALHIPKGWWHNFRSSENTIGVSVDTVHHR